MRNIKVKELRKLPMREWDETKTYTSIAIIPSGNKHDSGFAWMYIIGLDEKQNPIEIAACCDDICWYIPEKSDMGLRNDMYYPSGLIHFWSNQYHFQVGASLSSTNVSLKKI